MLNRRHIRVKVMQSIYAMHQHQSDNLDKKKNFFIKVSKILKTYIFYCFSALIEIKNKKKNISI